VNGSSRTNQTRGRSRGIAVGDWAVQAALPIMICAPPLALFAGNISPPLAVMYATRMADPRIPPSHRDLLESPIPVALATVGPTGHPQVTAIWAIPAGDSIVTSLAGVRQKLKNLVAHPRATVFIIDPANPYRTLEVRGDVTIEPDPELETLQKVLAAYGTDLASFPGPLEDRTTVTLHPTRVVALG
jgi:PPOX class probable F420-dependent enzyme